MQKRNSILMAFYFMKIFALVKRSFGVCFFLFSLRCTWVLSASESIQLTCMCLLHSTDSSIIHVWMNGNGDDRESWENSIVIFINIKNIQSKIFWHRGIRSLRSDSVRHSFRKCNIFYISFCQICRSGPNQIFQKCLFVILNS